MQEHTNGDAAQDVAPVLSDAVSPAKVVVYVKPKLPRPYKIPFPLKGNLEKH